MSSEENRRRRRRGRPKRRPSPGLASLRGRFAVRSTHEAAGLPYVDVPDAPRGAGEDAGEEPPGVVAADPPRRRSRVPRQPAHVPDAPGYLVRLIVWSLLTALALGGSLFVAVVFLTGPLDLSQTRLTDATRVGERPVVGAIVLALFAPLLGALSAFSLLAAVSALGRALLAAIALTRTLLGEPGDVTFTRAPGPRALVPVRRTRLSDGALRLGVATEAPAVFVGAWSLSTALLYAVGIVRWPVTSPVLLTVLGMGPLALGAWGVRRAWRAGGPVTAEVVGRLYAGGARGGRRTGRG